MNDNPTSLSGSATGAGGRKGYSSPRLTGLGQLRITTQAGTVGNAEGAGMSPDMQRP
jgi:hypothetical protein